MSASRIDEPSEIARIAGHAARALLARRRPLAAEILTRSFRRDTTAFGYRACGLDALAIAFMPRGLPIWHVPGKVVAVGEWRDDGLGEEHVKPVVERGGTVITEGRALANIRDLSRSSSLHPNAVEVDGPGIRDLLPSAIAPLFWLGEGTWIPGATRGLDVLVHAKGGEPLPLVSRAGSFVHFAAPVVPSRAPLLPDSERITPAAFAALAEIPASGPLAERDATMPEPLFRAIVTMLVVMADVVANALDSNVRAATDD